MQHSSHFGLIHHRSKANCSPEWLIHTPRSQPVKHNICFPIKLAIQRTPRPLLPLHFRLSLPTIKTLLRLCRRLYPASNFHLELHLRRPPSQHSWHPITCRRRSLPSILYQNHTTAPRRRPPRHQRHLRRRRCENERWKQGLVRTLPARKHQRGACATAHRCRGCDCW